MVKTITSLLAVAVASLVVVAAPATAAPRSQYQGQLEHWVNGHHPVKSGFQASHSSAWCSSFEHKSSSSKRWRFCKVYEPYTNSHHSDDWTSWDEQVCWSHWKVFWRFHKPWQFQRQDNWQCQDLTPQDGQQQ